MKKIIFMLAFMLMSGFAFANEDNNYDNEAVKKTNTILKVDNFNKLYKNLKFVKICNITHRVIDENGNVMATYSYSVDVGSSKTCRQASAELKHFSNWLANGMPGLF